jgi:hypothetical protein
MEPKDEQTDIFKKLAELDSLQAHADQTRRTLYPEMDNAGLARVLSKRIKNDYVCKLITFYAMELAYTHDSQLNISYNAQSAAGKSYITTNVANLFPVEDRIELNRASPTALFYKEGVFDEEAGANIVDLTRKILIFYEVPSPETQKVLRSVMSHDTWDNRSLITNKDKKGSNRGQSYILRGFPTTIFCSAGLQLDEQEATRAILLSPEITNDKLTASIHFAALRNSGDTKFLDDLENDPDIKQLKKRIEDIKAAEVDDIYIPNVEAIEQRFLAMVGKAKPRHSRDIDRLLKLVKAAALLNLWHRLVGDKVVAQQVDVDQAFELWGAISDSQESNVPPVLSDLYNNVIVPAYMQKLADPKYTAAMKSGAIGLSRDELYSAYTQRHGYGLNSEYYRSQMQPQLKASGLIAVRKPDDGDRRSLHIFPLDLTKTI